MTSTSTRPDGLQAREQLLDASAVDGLDVEGARERLAALRRSRDLTRRLVLGGVAALLLVALGAWAFLGEDDPDELVADREDPTTSTTSTTSTTAPVTTTILAAEVAPAVTAPVTTAPVATTTIPPTTAPTTTVPTNQPMRAQLTVRTPVVRAGDVAVIEVAWIDADHVGGDPVLVSDWGDPSVQAAQPTSAASTGCESPGVSAGGTLRQEFRYATTGMRRVQVAVTTCGGQGAFAERVTLEAQVTVTDALLDDVVATAVVVTGGAAPGQAIPMLDDATAELLAPEPSSEVIALPGREPALGQVTPTGPATVLVLPRGAVGTVRLTWPGSPCTATAPVDLRSPGAAAAVLPLTGTC